MAVAASLAGLFDIDVCAAMGPLWNPSVGLGPCCFVLRARSRANRTIDGKRFSLGPSGIDGHMGPLNVTGPSLYHPRFQERSLGIDRFDDGRRPRNRSMKSEHCRGDSGYPSRCWSNQKSNGVGA